MHIKRTTCFAVLLIAFISAQAAFSQATKSWLSTDFSIENSVGIGTFVSGSRRVPDWTTLFTLLPKAELPIPQSFPKMFMSAELAASVVWLGTQRIEFPDLIFEFGVPTIYEIPQAGISFSTTVPVIAPTSLASRAMNRVLGTGLDLGIKWTNSNFSLALTPALRGFIYGDELKSFRQSVMTIKTKVAGSWNHEAHKISAGVTYYWNFLRPLEYRPELASQNSNSQSWTQSVMGKVAYSYGLPLPLETTLTAGIVSFQSVFSKTGSLLSPFFDFQTPNKNQTQIFLEMTASL